MLPGIAPVAMFKLVATINLLVVVDSPPVERTLHVGRGLPAPALSQVSRAGNLHPILDE